MESLLTQGEIIAGAISASASVDTNSITIDPEKLLELQAGESITPLPSDEDLEFPIIQERVAPVLRRLISPTRTRARLFDADADLLLDSRHLYSGGQVLRFDLPPVDPESPSLADEFGTWFNRLLQPGDLPLYKEPPGGNGSIYPEVMNALTGVRGAVVRVTEKGELIVSVAVPVQRFRAVLGVLLLSTQAGDIDKIVHAERLAIIRVFGVAALVNVILSLLSRRRSPTRSAAFGRGHPRAPRRRQGTGGDPGLLIPPGRNRQSFRGAPGDDDGALRPHRGDREFRRRCEPRTQEPADVASQRGRNLAARAQRGIEEAADGRHPARRATPRPADQRYLDASRLDAELARADAKKVDLEKLLGDLVEISRQIRGSKKPVLLDFVVDRKDNPRASFIVSGYELRIGQIITNLIENARSFVPEQNGRIVVRLTRSRSRCIVYVEDNGPGIQAEDIDRIFERFYTDRPEGEDFGQNSGLGLSISRQIAEAHGGTLRAENIAGKDGRISGARFALSLPAGPHP